MGRFVLVPHPATESSITLPLPEGTHLVGRAADCRVMLESSSVSRRHAHLTVAGRELVVTDLGSRNGTFIDDARITSGRARPGQLIRFGSAAFHVQMQALQKREPSWEEETTQRGMEPRFSQVSPAQQRILDLLLLGLGEKQIADQLYLSVHTVHTHIRALYRLFDVHSRSELVVRALQMKDGRKATAWS